MSARCGLRAGASLVDFRKAARAFGAAGAWVSQRVLAATMWVLDGVHERTAAQLAAAIERLLNHQQWCIRDAAVVANALEHFRKRRRAGRRTDRAIDVRRLASILV